MHLDMDATQGRWVKTSLQMGMHKDTDHSLHLAAQKQLATLAVCTKTLCRCKAEHSL